MVWVKLDDHFDENPKIASVGPLGIALWVTGLAYCNRNLTDGFIPWATAHKLLSWEYIEPCEDDGRRKIQQISVTCGMGGDDVRSDRVIDLLLDAGLWDIAEDGSGYNVHDYDQFQPLKEKVEAERQASAERTAKSRSQSRGRNAVSNTVTNTRSNGVGNAVSNTAPVPDPVNVSSIEEPLGHDNNSEAAGFRDRYGTLTTALGVQITERLAYEFKHMAEEHDIKAITTAINACLSANKRPYPSELRKYLPATVSEPKPRGEILGFDNPEFSAEMRNLPKGTTL